LAAGAAVVRSGGDDVAQDVDDDVEDADEDDDDDELEDEATRSDCCSLSFTLRSRLDGRLRLARGVTLLDSRPLLLVILSWLQLVATGVDVAATTASAAATAATMVAVAADVLVVEARSSVN